jgi:hypothetical protein
MTALFWAKREKIGVRAGVLGLALLAVFAQGSALAADDDDDKNSIWNLDQRIFEGFAKGLGLMKQGDSSIDYRERAPLVIPPSRDLPPPQAGATNRAANWPVDPDIKRRQDSASRKTLDRRRSYDEEAQGRAILPSELDRGGNAGAKADKPQGPGGNPDGTNLEPSQLGYFGGLFSPSTFGFGGQQDEVATFKKEPPRSSLTEPPVGYQTPSPAQPYGVSKSTGGRNTTVTPLDPAVGR